MTIKNRIVSLARQTASRVNVTREAGNTGEFQYQATPSGSLVQLGPDGVELYEFDPEDWDVRVPPNGGSLELLRF